jgi:hypothetical protein
MKKIILGDIEYEVLQKVLRDNPPAKVNLDGAERYFYRRVLTQILHEDYRFPDTDEGMEVSE